MFLESTLEKIVESQGKEAGELEYGLERGLLKKIPVNLPFAIVLSGIRRCGKSTLLRQIMKKKKSFHYFNFEDPRAAGFNVNDFQGLDRAFLNQSGDSKDYFFDEIQNVDKWESFVRGKLDNKKHVFITGSNASLLSRELGTKLTGRHLRFEVFPFSFKEFLEFTKKPPGLKAFNAYFNRGGFPDYLKYGRTEILHELLNDVLTRDVAVRYKLRNVKMLRELTVYLLSNIGKEFSYNNLKKLFGAGSTNSITAFVSHLEDSYLLFTVPKFDYSLKKQAVNAKKVYAIDNGLCKANSASFSPDTGRMLENIVFLGLRRKRLETFYYRKKGECDFLVKEKNKISQAIQVCLELNESNKEREISGLLEALNEFKLEKGLILTREQEETFKAKGKKIEVIPVWKWLLK